MSWNIYVKLKRIFSVQEYALYQNSMSLVMLIMENLQRLANKDC